LLSFSFQFFNTAKIWQEIFNYNHPEFEYNLLKNILKIGSDPILRLLTPPC